MNSTLTRSSRPSSPVRRSMSVFAAIAVFAAMFIPVAPANAQNVSNDRSVEFKITDVTVTGTVVRVRYDLPNDCSWRFAVNSSRESLNPTRVIIRASGTPLGYGEVCSSSPSSVSSVFEITQSVTSIVDTAGKTWWSRPGAVSLQDFNVTLAAKGSKTLAVTTTSQGLFGGAFLYQLACKNGVKRTIRQPGPRTFDITKLRKGTRCMLTVTTQSFSGSTMKKTAGYVKVL